jgi:ABC-2 type transport system ATP-binding protein
VPEPGREIAPQVGEIVRRQNIVVDEMVVEQGRLDDVFRDLTAAPAH